MSFTVHELHACHLSIDLQIPLNHVLLFKMMKMLPDNMVSLIKLVNNWFLKCIQKPFNDGIVPFEQTTVRVNGCDCLLELPEENLFILNTKI